MHYLPEKENKTLNTNYRILRTIGRDFFSLNTLASTYRPQG